MKCIFNPWLVSLTILLLGLGAWLYATAFSPQLHPVGYTCVNCHLAGDNTDASNASMLIAAQETLCTQCHVSTLGISHPSGFKPGPEQTISASYPLDRRGALTCSTCHLVHSEEHGKLRGSARGAEMCLSCHTKTFFDSGADGGTSLTSSGHLGATASGSWKALDTYSIECLGCHAENGDVNLDSNQVLGNHGSLSHPVGRNYKVAAKSGGYRPFAKLPKMILLPQGMVSCVSCHVGYSKNHGKLVMSNAGSALCFACHKL